MIVAAILTIGIEVGVAEDDKRSTAWIEGFAILAAVMVCVLVTAINDYQKEREFIKLNKEKEKSKVVTVIRRARKEEIHQDDLLVGDLVKVSGGMEVPSDGFIL